MNKITLAIVNKAIIVDATIYAQLKLMTRKLIDLNGQTAIKF